MPYRCTLSCAFFCMLFKNKKIKFQIEKSEKHPETFLEVMTTDGGDGVLTFKLVGVGVLFLFR